ncbi:DUF983 domain-containing protein [Reyranella sp. CPCC 100927]|uniref:DUF983 domain-containing protein n=1 Tax=Reyranella sp. CPCC 100927 TaxID=2599616 RepID=UPI001C49A47A|nr:DUF983 domain-containing protein [Reyranella sp. CPCC 100927]
MSNDDKQARDWVPAMWRGWAGRCPACGARSLFTGYLKMAPACTACGADLEAYRADDAPAYFVIFIVGHIVVPLVLLVEKLYEPALWVHAALFLPLTIGLCLWLLPRVKGAVIGVLWALRVRSRQPG